ncbi:MAG: hypothetical protein LBG58_08430 [Planctomycetaceae bacterium]|jgi:hypothetical protein|nr:hypothetical protein [Planctomycetaceae bacterium]
MLNQNITIKILPLLFILFVTGCGGIKVSGKVTFPDGSPLDTGKVTFESDQNSFFGTIQKDGTFQLGRLKDGDGIIAGKYRVAVNASTPEVAPNGFLISTTHFVAEKFRSPKTSGIEYDIQKKTTNISIVVEPPKPGEEKQIPLASPKLPKKK